MNPATFRCAFDIGDQVFIDGDFQLAGTVTCVAFETALHVDVKVCRFHNGARYDEWYVPERLTFSGKPSEGGKIARPAPASTDA